MNKNSATAEHIWHWLRLLRLPNVFTALADILAGYLFVWPSLRPWPVFACLALSSCAIYLGGMVLNDVCDAGKDRRERPHRPIPAGNVDRGIAWRAAIALLALGVVFALTPALTGWNAANPWRSPVLAGVLAGLVVAYDVKLKSTRIGPLVMGACRAVNWSLAMSTAIAAETAETFLGFDASQWLIVVGYGSYITGVTWFARTEATVSSRRQLVWGIVWILVGVVLIGLFPFHGAVVTGERPTALLAPVVWPLLLALLMFPVFRRCATAVQSPTPENVQSAVRLAIHSIIVLNAGICLAVRTPFWWSVGILFLLLPMSWLARRIETT